MSSFEGDVPASVPLRTFLLTDVLTQVFKFCPCANHFRLFYYRKEIWEQILYCAMKKHESDGIWEELKVLRIDADVYNVIVPDDFDSSTMSFFTVRILPKTKGVRCLMKKQDIRIQNRPPFIQVSPLFQ